MQKMKIRILFVFTCAVVEVVDQNDQHESDAYDPGHDGSVSAALRQSVRIILREKRNPDNYIPTLIVHLHVGLQSLS